MSIQRQRKKMIKIAARHMKLHSTYDRFSGSIMTTIISAIGVLGLAGNFCADIISGLSYQEEM